MMKTSGTQILCRLKIVFFQQPRVVKKKYNEASLKSFLLGIVGNVCSNPEC